MTVWLKRWKEDEWNDTPAVCNIFGSIKAVNRDKMTYADKAHNYIQRLLTQELERKDKLESEKLPFRLSLEDVVNKERDKIQRKLIAKIEKELARYNARIKECEVKIETYFDALEHPLTAVDMYLKKEGYSYEEHEVIL